MNERQPYIDTENLYAEKIEPKADKAGITLTEFVEGLKELRRQHNEDIPDSRETEQ